MGEGGGGQGRGGEGYLATDIIGVRGDLDVWNAVRQGNGRVKKKE